MEITMETDWGAKGAQLTGAQVQAFIKNELKDLHTKYTTLATQIKELSTTVGGMDINIKDTDNTITQIQADIKKISQDISDLTKSINSLQKAVSLIEIPEAADLNDLSDSYQGLEWDKIH